MQDPPNAHHKDFSEKDKEIYRWPIKESTAMLAWEDSLRKSQDGREKLSRRPPHARSQTAQTPHVEKQRPALGECLAHLAAAMPVAFLEPALNEFNTFSVYTTKTPRERS
ncbi:ryanodine receptor 1-like protein, partial [Lates japonicus]